MNIQDSRNHRVWKVHNNNGFVSVDLGDGKKNKDGTYTNYSWFKCGILGNAKTKNIQEGNIITIKSGIIGKREYQGKYYDDIAIFDFEVTGQAQPRNNAPQQNQYDQRPQSEQPQYQQQNSGNQGVEDDLPF